MEGCKENFYPWVVWLDLGTLEKKVSPSNVWWGFAGFLSVVDPTIQNWIDLIED